MYRVLGAFFLFTTLGHAQENADSVKYDYSMLYQSGSTSLNKHSFRAGYKQPFGNGSLSYSVAFAAFTMRYKNTLDFDTENLKNINTVKLGVSYAKPLNEKWSAVAAFTPSITSNFRTSITAQDIYPQFFVGASRSVIGEKDSQLTIGFVYSGIFGKPMFLPFVNYHRQISSKLSFTLGLPAIDLKYRFNDKNSITSLLSADSFYSKIRGENYEYPTGENPVKIEAIKMFSAQAGIQYDYVSDENWTGTLKLGHSLANKMELYDGANHSAPLNFSNALYISVGFKYNLTF